MGRRHRRTRIQCFIAALLCAAMSACAPSPSGAPHPVTEAPIVVLSDTGAPTPRPGTASNLVPSDAETAGPEQPQATADAPAVSETTGRTLPEGHTYRPVAAVIGNAPRTRPQTGLMLADIVYEAALDRIGNETRFLAVFADALPAVAGPVEDARSYLVLLQKEWGGMVLFNGYPGAKDYPALISQDMALGLENEGEAAAYYFYDNTVSDLPEHTLFARVRDMADGLYGSLSPMPERRFAFQAGVTYPFGKRIEAVGLPFVGSDMAFVEFRYSAADNLLYRYQRNSKGTLTAARTRTPGADGTAMTTEQIAVGNLIVQYVPYSSIDTVYRTARLVGSGDCDCFINGFHITGQWRRESAETPTRYYLKNGEPLTLEPGTTWIALHPTSRPIRVGYAD